MNFKTTCFAFIAVLFITSCDVAVPPGPQQECAPITMRDWHKDHRKSFDFLTGYGAVYDTYIDFSTKSDRSNSFTCKIERIWCPAPYDTKGCQMFFCEAEEDAGTLVSVKDHLGERFYKVPVSGKVIWDGSTYRCAS